jgi:Cupin-like domain
MFPQPLPPSWHTWLAEGRLLGWCDEDLTTRLVQYGFDAAAIRDAMSKIDADPLYRAGEQLRSRLQKLESILRIREELTRLSTRAYAIERRSCLSQDEFREEYYSSNCPVVVVDAVPSWRAWTTWSAALFRSACGDVEVEVMADRNGDPRYEENSDQHKRWMRMADYVDTVSNAKTGNDLYMVANNGFLDNPVAATLRGDLQPLPSFLTPIPGEQQAFLWFGPAETITPLHHDTMNVLLAQIRGRKHITLISPEQTPWVHNEVGVYSRVDVANPDVASFPSFAFVHKLEVVLAPGEALFLPVGWWHHVRALDPSISVSFTNFAFPNSYRWTHPSPRPSASYRENGRAPRYPLFAEPSVFDLATRERPPT